MIDTQETERDQAWKCQQQILQYTRLQVKRDQAAAHGTNR
eukprot:CAMPEP_0172806648 /NCGR_PEP_ID=MMETSP1075-20121228/6489_1 /TAXON_ID=2916 /ORGANISM="Ceratium fusus, Strain PA161109" /LENGTH=39 /DNA_ID= /DNA_START= /DNA_END= /DNA_ORIENTATION=